MAKITCLDGVGCIGGNKILLEDGGKRLFFDFGKNFGREGKFYEEFVQPKSCGGLYEHLVMGLLPPFRDLYRDDLTSKLCDPWSLIDAPVLGDVAGVLVSHAHVDHIGSIHHLRTDIPIYCTPITAAISRALQDTGLPTASEYCYYVPRNDDPSTGINTPNYRSVPAECRQYFLTAPASSDFESLWAGSPSARGLIAKDCRNACDCGGMTLRNFPVDHSVFGATAWAVETEAGWVVYTGDIRMHGGSAHQTLQFAEEAAKLTPAALIIEGTRISSDASDTEDTVRDACLNMVKGASGLVVADFGPRNVERLLSFLQIARHTHRKLVVMPKDAYLLDVMRRAAGNQIPVPDGREMLIYREYETSTGKWKQQVFDDYPGAVVTPSEIAADQADYICCFSFWDVQELAYIRPTQDSVWIYSSCEPFCEEMEIDMRRLREWLDFFDMRLVGEDCESEADAQFHVSGHASGSDLVRLVETIRPRKLIPIHSEKPEVYVDRVGGICEVILPQVGQAVAV